MEKVLEKRDYEVFFKVKSRDGIEADGSLLIEVIDDGYTEKDLVADGKEILEKDLGEEVEILCYQIA